MRLRRLAAFAVTFALTAGGMVLAAAPASASATAVFQCKDASGYEGEAEFSAGWAATSTAPIVTGPIDVSYDRGDTWFNAIPTWGVPAHWNEFVDHVYVGGDTAKVHPYRIRWTTPDHTYTCDAMYYPIGIDAHPNLQITRGQSVSILASMSPTDYPDVSRITMVAYLKNAGTWKAAGEARVSALSGVSLVTVTAHHSADLQVRVFDDRKDPGHTLPLGVQDLQRIVVNQPTPYLEMPGTVYAGQTATLRAWYGTSQKGYTVILERWNGDMWTYVDDKNTDATQSADLQWKPTAAAKYRLQFYGEDAKGNSKLVRTQHFTYAPSYKVTLSGPRNATKNSSVKLRAAFKFAPTGYAYVQNVQHGKWVTVWHYTVKGTTSSIRITVHNTGKWRVVSGGYISNTITITAK